MPEKETEMNAVKKYPVITISREYGALGRTLAAELSERLGIPYYDKDFVKKAADESGYAEKRKVRSSNPPAGCSIPSSTAQFPTAVLTTQFSKPRRK